MNKLKLAYVLLLGIVPAVAEAQEGPSATWGNSMTFRNPSERLVDLQRAEAQKRARNGGYNGPQVTYNGNVDYTTNQTINGDVSNSNSTNAVNLNDFSSSVKNEGDGSVGVTFTTGNTSYQASQNAVAQNTTSESGSANSGVSSPVHNSGSGF